MLHLLLLSVAFHAAAAQSGWRSGISSEERFWDSWLKTRGGQWPGDFKRRMSPSTRFCAAPHLPASGARYRVLDVGAGPITSCGYRIKRAELDIVAVDPLAHLYDRLLARHNLVPPVVRTQPLMGESLLASFGEGSFDLVMVRNALDHAKHPLDVILQMVHVAKPGCKVVIVFVANERTHERGGGFHKWDMRNVRGRFFIEDEAGEEFDIGRLVAPYATVSCDHHGELRNSTDPTFLTKRVSGTCVLTRRGEYVPRASAARAPSGEGPSTAVRQVVVDESPLPSCIGMSYEAMWASFFGAFLLGAVSMRMWLCSGRSKSREAKSGSTVGQIEIRK